MLFRAWVKWWVEGWKEWMVPYLFSGVMILTPIKLELVEELIICPSRELVIEILVGKSILIYLIPFIGYEDNKTLTILSCICMPKIHLKSK